MIVLFASLLSFRKSFKSEMSVVKIIVRLWKLPYGRDKSIKIRKSIYLFILNFQNRLSIQIYSSTISLYGLNGIRY